MSSEGTDAKPIGVRRHPLWASELEDMVQPEHDAPRQLVARLSSTGIAVAKP